MPMIFPTYPLDLTGTASSNYIVNEVRTFTVPGDRIFVPTGGPFYLQNFEIRNAANNALLMPNVDYKALHLHVEGTKASGRTVCSVIKIENTTLSSVVLNYHVIGGIFGETPEIVHAILENNPPVGNVIWEQIMGAPVQFPPTDHLHHADEIYGLQELVSILEHLRVAILAGDGSAFQAVYQYINNRLANEDYVTQDQLANSAGKTVVVTSIDALRALTGMVTLQYKVFVTLGLSGAFDNEGRMFVWNGTSMAVDNGQTIIRPDSIAPGDPGRFHSILHVDGDIQALNSAINSLIPTPPQVGMMLVSNGVTPGSWTWAPIAAGQPISQSFIWVSANTGHVTSTLHMRTSGSGVRIGAYYYHSATPVTLDITGITTNTFRYVYAYLNGGNLALEISTTVYQRAADGAPWYHKIGDVTRAFVGMIYRDWDSSGGFIYSRSFYGDRRQFIERPPVSTLLDFRQPSTAVSLTADVPIYITNDYGEIDLYTSAAAIAESDLPVIVFPEETITIEANFHWIWNTVEGSAEGRVHIVTHRSGNLNSIHVLARYALTDSAASGDDRYMNGSFHDTVQIFGYDDVIQRLHFRALRNNTASAAIDKVLAIGAHGTVDEVLGDNRFVQVVHLPGTYPVAYNSRNRTGFRIHYDSQPEWHWMYP